MAHIQCAKIIPATKFKVFDYLTSPQNFEELVANHFEAKWQNVGVQVQPGAEFLFLMTRFGVEQPVRFVIDRMVVGNSLTYRQLSGIYARFVHTMKFEDHGLNETLVTDLVDYELPFGIFGRMADDFFARGDLKQILEARLDIAVQKFGTDRNENLETQKETQMS